MRTALVKIGCVVAVALFWWGAAVGMEANKHPAFTAYDGDDFEISEAMVPMRDGVRLYTVIVRPRDTQKQLPILFEHTPYHAEELVTGYGWLGITRSPSLAATLGPPGPALVKEGFIFVKQDVRGKGHSEGAYTVYPMPHQPGRDDDQISASTDIYDTIEWLVNNVENNNSRVGMWGTSYPGMTALESLLVPHPNLKAIVPINPVVDLWLGDDFFHQGAFRLAINFDFIWGQAQDYWTTYPFGARDMYDWYLNAGPTAGFSKRYFKRSFTSWDEMIKRPTYDDWWQAKALQRLLPAAGSDGVEVLHVHSWFDQEDSFGAPAAYAALEGVKGAQTNYFVGGPWYHSQWDRSGYSFGPIKLGGDTSKYFRDEVLVPFLRRTLKTTGQLPTPAEARVFETGSNKWRSYAAWPPKAAQLGRLYLGPSGTLTFVEPDAGAPSASDFISDPHKPVPFRQRPILAPYADGSTWSEWLADDQRFAATRPDVLTFVSPPLSQEFRMAGPLKAVLTASTTGSDADWVVKLIDVYPPEYPEDPALGGYQFMVSGDIMRGRYRESYSRPKPIEPGSIETYAVHMPHINHVFRPGHRIMVQIQSSWFPLYDRNPQTYVENIHFAETEDFQRAIHTIHHGSDGLSYIEGLTLAIESPELSHQTD